jgi:hypothetical protein
MRVMPVDSARQADLISLLAETSEPRIISLRVQVRRRDRTQDLRKIEDGPLISPHRPETAPPSHSPSKSRSTSPNRARITASQAADLEVVGGRACHRFSGHKVPESPGPEVPVGASADNALHGDFAGLSNESCAMIASLRSGNSSCISKRSLQHARLPMLCFDCGPSVPPKQRGPPYPRRDVCVAWIRLPSGCDDVKTFSPEHGPCQIKFFR